MTAIANVTSRATPLRILVAERFAARLEAALTVPHVLRTTTDEDRDEEIAAKLRQIDVFISSTFKSAWATPGEMSLRLIQGVGAGTDGIDMTAVPSACTVCNVYGHAYAIAEYTFMVMAMLNREVRAQDAALRQGAWGGGVTRAELRGRTLLVIGLGHIGAEVVRWGQFMGMRPVGLTRTPSPERAQELGLASIGGLDALPACLPEADFVVVAIPHTAETTGYIDTTAFQWMKPTAFLVNVARGPVVDEADLYAALRDQTIAGAAMDVWYRYPDSLEENCMPSTYPFQTLDNIIMTPHTAGWTDGTRTHRFAFIADNIRRLAAGEALQNIVRPPAP